jgi:hypothetical protein
MHQSTKRILMTAVATAAVLGLTLPAHAGKGGSFGGMSRGGGSMARSMGSMRSSTSARTMSAGNFSSRNFTTPARGMARPSFGQSNAINSSARYMNSSVSRGRGVSSLSGGQRLPARLGTVQNAAKGTVANRGAFVDKLNGNKRVSDFVKGSAKGAKALNGGSFSSNRIQKVVGERLGPQRSSQKKPAGVAESLLKGRINTRNIAKIDRSKLRDLVKGIESGKVARPVDGDRGDRLVDLSGAKIADALRGGRLGQFNKSARLASNMLPLKAVDKSLLTGGCFPTHDDHFGHDHWLGLHLGDLWFGHCHDDHYNPYYDYCWQPNYVAPPCTVTSSLNRMPNWMQVAANRPRQ